MVEVGSPELKKLQKFYAGRVPVILHSTLYIIKLTYPTDVGSIALDGRMTAEMGTWSLEQSVGVLTAADSRPVTRGINLENVS